MKFRSVEVDLKNIGIIGLGYVGLPLAVEFGRVRPTIGYDIDSRRIDELKQGQDRTNEVESADLAASTFLTLTSTPADLVPCQVYIITVPTPIDSAKRPDLTPLILASELVGGVLNVGDIVIFESTVFPGCTEEECVPLLERASGLKFNVDFYCGYSPERINPGDKVNTLTKIKKITSGSTPRIAKEVDDLYGEIITAGTYSASSIKVAEAAKVIENTQRDLNIAFVNELSLIFERMKIDTIEVLEAAGTKWNFFPFRPGLVGGHCIGVDPYYLTYKAEELGYVPQVLLAGRRINDDMAGVVARAIVKKMVSNDIHVSQSKIMVLGATFKDDCPDIRNSKVFDLVSELETWGIEILLIDPWADAERVESEYGRKLSEFSENLIVDSIVVAVGHSVFRNFDIEVLRSICRSTTPVFADLKAIYDIETLQLHGFDVFRL